MRYVVVCCGDPLARWASRSLVAIGESVLALDHPNRSGLAGIVQFVPDLFLVRPPAGRDGPSSHELVLELAAFGRKPVVALLTREELAAFGPPKGVHEVVVAGESIGHLARRLRLVAGTASPADDDAVLRCGDVTINAVARTVHIGEQRVSLTLTEFDILLRLCQYGGRVLPRRLIVHGLPRRRAEDISDRAVDVFVRRLRQKLADARSFRIETVRNVGYRCDVQALPCAVEASVPAEGDQGGWPSKGEGDAA